MSELSEDEVKNFAGSHMKPKKSAYIKIKTLCGRTFPAVHTLLEKVCENAALDRDTVKW